MVIGIGWSDPLVVRGLPNRRLGAVLADGDSGAPCKAGCQAIQPAFFAGGIAVEAGNVTPALTIFPTESGRCGIFLNRCRIPGTLTITPRRAARGDFRNQRG
jgi:hypothetical protein